MRWGCRDRRHHIHYAVKANDHLAILAILARRKARAPMSSAWGSCGAPAAQPAFPHADIVFSGVGKTPADLMLAVAEGISQINVESRAELAMLSAIAQAEGVAVLISFFCGSIPMSMPRPMPRSPRAGPRINSASPPGMKPRRPINLCGQPAGLRPVGLAVHIGSQILSPDPYAKAYARVADLVRALRAAGHTVSVLDLGGGMGIAYAAEPVFRSRLLPRPDE